MKRTFWFYLAISIFTGNNFYANIVFKPLNYIAKFELAEGVPKVMQEFNLTLSIKFFL